MSNFVQICKPLPSINLGLQKVELYASKYSTQDLGTDVAMLNYLLVHFAF